MDCFFVQISKLLSKKKSFKVPTAKVVFKINHLLVKELGDGIHHV
jgi:hypothetical protein